MSEQLKTTMLGLFLVTTLICGGTAVYFFMDNSSLRTQYDEQSAELDEASASVKKLEQENGKLKAEQIPSREQLNRIAEAGTAGKEEK